jgi:hypothetical protein
VGSVGDGDVERIFERNYGNREGFVWTTGGSEKGRKRSFL